MARLAIADPPYLGRANRWYGTGRGHAGGHGRADCHPYAALWDTEHAHLELLAELRDRYDGWAVALPPSSLPLYLAHTPATARVGVWVRPNAIPSGARVRTTTEYVLVQPPPARVGHGTGPIADDVLIAPAPRGEFTGAKPEAWTHWIADLLGYQPDHDQVVDIFPGSGAVTAALATYRRNTTTHRHKPSPAVAQRLRSTARASRDRRAAVLKALADGGSVRAVAAEAGISTNTVQRWKRESTP